MNSFISHRLYAVAAANVPNSAPKPDHREAGFGRVAGIASAIPLELMESGKTPRPTAARRLRTTPAPARS
jgi:hypothetical protein